MSMVTIEESDDEKSIVTGKLRLKFQLVDRRWIHALECHAGGEWCPIASSVEANTTRDGPDRFVSATFQELVIQASEVEAIALLVGHQTRHHFSAEFRATISPTTDGGYSATVGVDVADRCLSGVDVLSATYVLHRPIGWVRDRDDWGAACDLDDAELSFGIIDRRDRIDRFAVAEVDGVRACVQFRAIAAERPGTQRLYYAFRFDRRPTFPDRSG